VTDVKTTGVFGPVCFAVASKSGESANGTAGRDQYLHIFYVDQTIGGVRKLALVVIVRRTSW
jgi:hypothetical protein